MSKAVCGVNGFGRFGLHLLNYYLESEDKSKFEIKFINDEILDIGCNVGTHLVPLYLSGKKIYGI